MGEKHDERIGTLARFGCETNLEYIQNGPGRSKGKRLAHLVNGHQWKYYPKKRIAPDLPFNVDIEASGRCQIHCDHGFRQYTSVVTDTQKGEA